VGEIRDAETAEIALHAALTGHLVLSTIHTNDAAGTIPRLIDLGINPQIIAPAVNMAMGQRLLRKLCPNCKVRIKINKEILDKLEKELGPIKEKITIDSIDESLEIYGASQCSKCNGLGYKGRVGVFEAFVVSKSIEKLILTSPAISEIEELAIKEGMITMLQDAYLKLLDGTTSIDEIKRILGS
jgi:type IV pilus assembly protein PilB